jgi:hypothetical protein
MFEKLSLPVELRGLEPLTPCLQSTPEATRTVPDVACCSDPDRSGSAWFGAVATGHSYRIGSALGLGLGQLPAHIRASRANTSLT